MNWISEEKEKQSMMNDLYGWLEQKGERWELLGQESLGEGRV